MFHARATEVARTAGAVVDAEAMLAIVRRFFAYLDKNLTLGEHDQRNRERYESLSGQFAQLQAEIRERPQAVVLASPGTVTPPPLGESNSNADREVAGISSLVDAGLFLTARDKLAKLSGTELSEDLRFRVATAAAICAYELGDKGDALNHFAAARDLRPGSAAAVSNLAAAYLSINDGTKALAEARKAWLIDPGIGAANYIAALHHTGHDDAISAFIPSDLESSTDAATMLALARVYLEQGYYAESVRFSRKAVELSGSPNAKEALAISLIGSFGFSRMRASAAALRSADQLLTEALDARRTWEIREDGARCLLNRAVVRCLGRNYAAALRDIDRSLDEHDMTEGHILRARILTALGRHAEALSEYERAIHQPVEDEVRVAYAHCLVEANRPAEALSLLEDLLGRSADAAARLEVAQIAVAAANALGNVELAESYIAKIGSDESARWATHAAKGYFSLRRGNAEHAVFELEVAAALAPADEAVLIRVNLARALGRAHRWSAAANLYAELATPDSDSEIVQNFAIALYNAGRYAELAALYDQYAGKRDVSRPLRDLRARVFEHAGDVRTARDLYLLNAAGVDGEAEDYLRAAEASWRLLERDRARELLQKVAIHDLVATPRLLLVLAELSDALGMDPMRVAYAACVVDESTPDVPAAYARLYQTWRPAIGSCSAVAPDCAVTLEITAASSTTVVVTDDPLHVRLSSHCGTASERGRILLGRGVGDVVMLPFDGVTTPAKVVGITHKLDFAYRHAFESSRGRFGAAAQIGLVDDDCVASLKDAPEGKALRERRQNVQRQYYAGELAVGVAADRSQSPTIRFFCRNMTGSDRVVQAFTGNHGDAERQLKALGSAREVILDLTSAITLGRLNLLDKLAAVVDSIGVTQSTVDSFLYTRRDVFGSEAAPIVGVVDGGTWVSEQIDQGFYNSERELLDRCIAFIGGYCVIVPVPDMVERPKRDLVRSFRRYGRVPTPAVFAAGRRSAVLLVDDVVTQRLAGEEGVAGIGSQVLLEILRERNIISHEQYVDALATLSALNYRFIRLGARDLYIALTSTAAARNAIFGELVLHLGDPECDVTSAIRVSVNLLCSLWQSGAGTDDQRRAATAVVILAAALMRGPAVGLAIRDSFLSVFARKWYEASGLLDNVTSQAIAAMHYAIGRLEMARQRVKPRFRERTQRGAGLQRLRVHGAQ